MAMSSTGRTRLQVLAAGLLALGGVLTILYAGMLPFPPFSDGPVPLWWQVFGVIELAAAVGVFGQQGWGRALGVVVAAMSLPLAVLLQALPAPGSSPANVAGLVLDVSLNVIVLWVLLRRWPARA
jgi:uncharacterized membrane protein (DUF2068 family)